MFRRECQRRSEKIAVVERWMTHHSRMNVLDSAVNIGHDHATTSRIWVMSTLPPSPEVSAEQIAHFLAAARDTIVDVKFAWLATRSLNGGTNARAVHVHQGASDDDEWTQRFVVRRGSRKVAEMRA